MASLLPRRAAIGAGAGAGARSPSAPHSALASVPASSRCRSSAIGRPAPSQQQPSQQQQPAASKYDRIVAFIDTHATPVVSTIDAAAALAAAGGAQLEQLEQQQQQQQPAAEWHHSYDEEAEEDGAELGNEPHLLACPAVAAAVAASAPAEAAPAAAVVLSSSWAYGCADNPKPWCFSWDEEAEGSFELSDCSRLAPAQQLAERRARLHEARHAARASRKMRRAQLHPQLGDLEQMQAWVGAPEQQRRRQQQQQQRSASGLRYHQLLALVAGDGSTAGHYRKPAQWHLTFDEDVHGPDAPDAMLGSC